MSKNKIQKKSNFTWCFRASKHSSNNEIHYFPLWSVSDLIDHYNAGCMPLSSQQWQHHSSGSGHTRYTHSALSPLKWKCLLCFPSQFISWFLLLPYDYTLLPVECQITGNNAHSSVGIYDGNCMCVVRDIIIYVRDIISCIREDIFMSTYRIVHFLCNCAIVKRCGDHCKRRSRFVQNRRDKSDPPHITFHSFFSPLLSVGNTFFLRSFSLYDSPFMFTTVQWCSILSRTADAITWSPRISPHSLKDLFDVHIVDLFSYLEETNWTQ